MDIFSIHVHFIKKNEHVLINSPLFSKTDIQGSNSNLPYLTAPSPQKYVSTFVRLEIQKNDFKWKGTEKGLYLVNCNKRSRKQ